MSYQPTLDFRWYQFRLSDEYESHPTGHATTYGCGMVLQQRFTNEQGQEQWRDISMQWAKP